MSDQTPIERPKSKSGCFIHQGDVLRKVDDHAEVGIVVKMYLTPGEKSWTWGAALGDIVVAKSPGISTVSNNYSSWEHVPHKEQTYRQRFESWIHWPWDPHEDSWVTGPLHLLPGGTNTIGEYDDWPQGQEALGYLADHCDDLSTQNAELKEEIASVELRLGQAKAELHMAQAKFFNKVQ